MSKRYVVWIEGRPGMYRTANRFTVRLVAFWMGLRSMRRIVTLEVCPGVTDAQIAAIRAMLDTNQTKVEEPVQ